MFYLLETESGEIGPRDRQRQGGVAHTKQSPTDQGEDGKKEGDDSGRGRRDKYEFLKGGQ